MLGESQEKFRFSILSKRIRVLAKTIPSEAQADMIRPFFLVSMALGVAGCQTTLPGPAETEVTQTLDQAPPGAAPGTCWGKDASPAIIETVTEQVLVQPAKVNADGTIANPAIYKTEARQAIVQERRDTWFEVPCENVLTPEFNASVQRALKARDLYRGVITGKVDGRTRAAIRRFQKSQGLDSGVLSMAAARRMGLISVKGPAPATQ